MSLSDSRPRAAHWAIFILLALLLQLPLIANPGYFSHDELQWGARAIDGVRADWSGVGALQYRPLTFAIWLALSRALFESPMLFHLAIAMFGALNATLLVAVVLRAGAAPRAALAAGVTFVLNPYAMYVHGWVATLADLTWCLCALGIAWMTLGSRRGVAPVAAVLTVAALLAKESALSIPALAVVGYLADTARRRRWRGVVIATGSVSAAYLLLRHAGLSSVSDADSYAWHLRNIPARFLQFELYPLLPRVFEVHNTLVAPRLVELLVAGVVLTALVAVLASRHWRWAVAFIAGGLAALGPVLVLDNPATQYGYALAAWNAGVFALAWPRLRRLDRVPVLLAVALVSLHAGYVARTMLHVGRVQAVYSPAVAAAVSTSTGVVRVAPLSPGDAWMFLRLSHQIPHYRGVVLLDRIQVVPAGAPADYIVAADGSLQPAR
ncbi:hypothetical protein [Cognatilysobacter lacus]|uniref:Glycosyltransferase RgtA/B/C/D-like domain-containing protein n=1 Tax=Cognatilysobacter lacus TaxID=1643323 RepID=A0A5D8Z755_9GAMM|nr:hypothetical protein [Lysobacter lacus]TZF90765.1 hypothetical protein FW784_03945 [Lysobacter lacus]